MQDDIIVIFHEQFIREQLKRFGFRQTNKNVDIVLNGIRNGISESQLVTWYTKRVITEYKDSLEKGL